MKLQKIVLNNFRSFYQEQTVNFCGEGDKKVTVIHAENHTGKTNFVDAFRWAFYGKISGEQPDQIVNHLALDNIAVGMVEEAGVVVSFSHEDKNYRVYRRVKEEKKASGKSSKIHENFGVDITNPDGRTTKSHKPQHVVENILPEGMDQYFFLAGEHIQQLGGEGSQEKIKDAIKTLMGLEIIDRAKRHLRGAVKNSLKEDLAKFANTDEKANLDETTRLERQKAETQNEIHKTRSNIQALKREIEAIAEKLKKGEKTRILQEKKEELEQNKQELQIKLRETESELMNLFSLQGFFAFSKKAVTQTQVIVSDKREKGVIPSNVRYQFILDLLEQGKCMCGRDLKEGEEPYTLVEGLKKQDATAIHESAFNDIGNSVAGLLRAHEQFPEAVKNVCKTRSDIQERLSIIEEEIVEISAQYDGKEFEDQRSLIERDKEIHEKLDDLKRYLWSNESRETELDKEIKDLIEKRKKISVENKQHRVAQKRLNLCEEAVTFFEKLHEALTHRDRKLLCERMNKIFKEIIAGRENAVIELNTEFEMVVKKVLSDGGTMILPKSDSQKQITCISFIASIIDIARSNLNSANQFARGGVFPLVLDSPFGVMAPDYRVRVANRLPHYAEQLVILVAPQQWDDAMENEFKPYIGARYSFHHYTATRSNPITITLAGKEHKLSEYVDGKQKTIIEEVN